MDKDYYEILGVGLYAAQAEVKKAYLELRQKAQRDHQPGHPYDKKLADIEEAYKVLSDFGSRAIYDMGRTKKRETAKAEKLKEANKAYYEALGVPVGASIRDVTVAYRKHALECHPDKHVNSDDATKAAAKVRFAEIEDAYAVLTGKRTMTGKKRGTPESSYSESPSHNPKRPKAESSQSYNPESPPSQSRSQHSGGSASGTGGTGSTGGTRNDNRKTPDGGVFKSTGNTFQSAGQSTGGKDNTQKLVPSQNIYLSLEEIANGCKREVNISREVVEPNGTTKMEERTEEIIFKPGWKAGTKLIFRKEYYPGINKPTTDIVLVIQEQRHPIFKREGSDISYTAKVNLREALLGTTVNVPTLAGPQKSFEFHNEIIRPTTTRKIPGRGLPFPKEPSKKGDFVVRFDIEFPYSLSSQAKEILSQILPV